MILRDIFDRMNNYGKRLSRAEVFAALHPGKGSSVEPFSDFQRIAESIHGERGFGVVDGDTVLHAVLARRGGDVTRDIRIEFSSERIREPRDFGSETPEKAYREGESGMIFPAPCACSPPTRWSRWTYPMAATRIPSRTVPWTRSGPSHWRGSGSSFPCLHEATG